MGNLKPLSANFTKWSNTLKQFVGKLPTNCLSVFAHVVGLALKGLNSFVFFQETHTTPKNEKNGKKILRLKFFTHTESQIAAEF